MATERELTSEAREVFEAWRRKRRDGVDSKIEPLSDAVAEELRRMATDAGFLDELLPDLGLGPIDVERALREARLAETKRLLDELGAHKPTSWPYEVVEEVGRGGFGIVSDAIETPVKRRVALKRPKFDDDTAKVTLDEPRVVRLLEEGRLLAQLDHPAVVSLYAVSVDEKGVPHLVMRFVDGVDMDAAIAAAYAGDATWTVPRLVDALRTVCDGVAHAHDRGIVHRDLKPDNVRLGARGEVSVMDWGLALDRRRGRRLVDPAALDVDDGHDESPRLTALGTRMGTPAYMAPEQALGHVDRLDERTDVYALGAMLFHVLTGAAPPEPADGWSAPTTRGDDPRLRALDDAPPALAAICRRAMQPEAARRYTTAAAMGDDLGAFLEGRVVDAYATGAWAEAVAWVRRNRLASGLAAAVVVTVVGGSVWLSQLEADRVQAIEERTTAEGEREVAVEERDRAEQEADRQEGLARLAQAEDLRDSGRWERSLALLGDESVTRLGSARADRLRVEALLALGRRLDARHAANEALARDPDSLADDHGERLVAAAHVAIAESRLDDARDYCVEAVDYDLRDADKRVIQAWLATDAPSAIRALTAAVDADPLQLTARSQLAILLALTGRADEAEFHVYFLEQMQSPRAPTIFRVVTTCLEGDFDAARVAATRDPVGAQLGLLIDFFETLDEYVTKTVLEQVGPPTQTMLLAKLVAAAAALPDDVLRGDVFHPVFATWRERLLDGMDAASSVALTKQREIELIDEATTAYREAHEALGESASAVLWGMEEMHRIEWNKRNKGGPASFTHMAQIESLFAAPTHTPSVIPGIQVPSLAWAVSSQQLLLNPVNARHFETYDVDRDAILARFRVGADRVLEARPDVDPIHVDDLVTTAFHIEDLDLVRRALDWRAETSPNSSKQPRDLHRLAVLEGDPIDIFDAAERWATVFPDHATAVAALDEARTRLAEAAASRLDG